MKYDTETGLFLDADGEIVAKKLIGETNSSIDLTNLNVDASLSQNLVDKLLCVAISISFEFEERMPCDPSNPNCKWSFFRYVPANCNNYHGSICQHWDHWGSKLNI